MFNCCLGYNFLKTLVLRASLISFSLHSFLFAQAEVSSNLPLPTFISLPPSEKVLKNPISPTLAIGFDNQPISSTSNQTEEIDRISDILLFWFGPLPGPDFFPHGKMQVWFASTPEVDRQIYKFFLQDINKAQLGEYNHWRESPQGRLALILLLDQFPRHIYRHKSQAFALDRMAQSITLEGIQKGDDKELFPIERAFFYLPLEHAEEPSLQNLSVKSYQKLLMDSPFSMKPQINDFYRSAVLHKQQIDRFGRFPYRNPILKRETTPEETVYLMQWGR